MAKHERRPPAVTSRRMTAHQLEQREIIRELLELLPRLSADELAEFVETHQRCSKARHG